MADPLPNRPALKPSPSTATRCSAGRGVSSADAVRAAPRHQALKPASAKLTRCQQRITSPCSACHGSAARSAAAAFVVRPHGVQQAVCGQPDHLQLWNRVATVTVAAVEWNLQRSGCVADVTDVAQQAEGIAAVTACVQRLGELAALA
jgi:hypothetical protein